MLYIFGGLPGTGKTALSRELARRRGALHLRIDTIEQVLRSGGHPLRGPEGYQVAYELAADNLRLGLEVVADSVNPLPITREAWRAVAERSGVTYAEVEVICSDRAEHQRRVESRPSDVRGLSLPTWEQVVNREYQQWDRAHLVLDTAGRTIEESFAALWRELKLDGRGGPAERAEE
jgi:predicted kinase